jgi:hypothetical protein
MEGGVEVEVDLEVEVHVRAKDKKYASLIKPHIRYPISDI